MIANNCITVKTKGEWAFPKPIGNCSIRNMVSVIILNYKSHNETFKYVVHLKEKIDEELSFVVVDNSDDVNEWNELVNVFINEYGFPIKKTETKVLINTDILLLKANGNLGYARGNNLGVAAAVETFNPKQVLISNTDIVISERISLKKWITTLNTQSDIAVIGPAIIGLDGEPQSPCRKLMFRERWFLNLLAYPFNRYIYKRPDEIIKAEGACKVYRLQGSFLFCDVDKLSRIEWFDEHTFLYGEELILAERLSTKEMSMYYDPSIKVLHNHNQIIGSYYSSISRDMMKLKSEAYYYTTYCHLPKIVYPVGKLCLYIYYGKKAVVDFIKK